MDKFIKTDVSVMIVYDRGGGWSNKERAKKEVFLRKRYGFAALLTPFDAGWAKTGCAFALSEKVWFVSV
jgi:hypothetical protein